MKTRIIKQIITSIIVTILLIKVLLSSTDFLSKIIVLPFLVFAIFLGLKNILILLNQKELAIKVSKIYVIAFLIYLFGFLLYWDYRSLMNKDYVQFLASLPFWIGGSYIIFKRFRENN